LDAARADVITLQGQVEMLRGSNHAKDAEIDALNDGAASVFAASKKDKAALEAAVARAGGHEAAISALQEGLDAAMADASRKTADVAQFRAIIESQKKTISDKQHESDARKSKTIELEKAIVLLKCDLADKEAEIARLLRAAAEREAATASAAHEPPLPTDPTAESQLPSTLPSIDEVNTDDEDLPDLPPLDDDDADIDDEVANMLSDLSRDSAPNPVRAPAPVPPPAAASANPFLDGNLDSASTSRSDPSPLTPAASANPFVGGGGDEDPETDPDIYVPVDVYIPPPTPSTPSTVLDNMCGHVAADKRRCVKRIPSSVAFCGAHTCPGCVTSSKSSRDPTCAACAAAATPTRPPPPRSASLRRTPLRSSDVPSTPPLRRESLSESPATPVPATPSSPYMNERGRGAPGRAHRPKGSKQVSISDTAIADTNGAGAPQDVEHMSVVKKNNFGRHKSVKWFKAAEEQRGVGRDEKGAVWPWFHGVISRRKSEALLGMKPESSFLVRVSESRFGYVSYYVPRSWAALCEGVCCVQHGYSILGSHVARDLSDESVLAFAFAVMCFPCGTA
jgi:hypothetical protein